MLVHPRIVLHHSQGLRKRSVKEVIHSREKENSELLLTLLVASRRQGAVSSADVHLVLWDHPWVCTMCSLFKKTAMFQVYMWTFWIASGTATAE